MARISQAQLAATLVRYKKLVGIPLKDYDSTINKYIEGGMHLDHYHGWQLLQVLNPNGGVTVVNRGVAERLTASEMLCFLHGMIRAVEDAKYETVLTTAPVG